MNSTDAIEHLRVFFLRRHWLRADLLLPGEWERLRDRQLTLDDQRVAYLRGFVDGWTRRG